MKYVSVRGRSPAVTFSEALERGLAPDGGLYIPKTIPHPPSSLLDHSSTLTLDAAGVSTISLFVNEVPTNDLRAIVTRTWNFPIPLVKLSDEIFLLELFHGPTLAFKDIGARFMAHILSYLLGQQRRKLTILVATSGDTGSAVAHGFFNVPNITVYILYPSGRISRLQEQHMTTLGGNIQAIEVEGSFDDCQELVKRALNDSELVERCGLTTANSINIGRLLPQICYYVWGVAQWKSAYRKGSELPSVIVPSGNFGNLTAAAYAKAIGTSIKHLVAATNANDVVPEYMRTGLFSPRPSRQTFSNAMDVGNPSNLVRLQSLYNNDIEAIRRDITAVSVHDAGTLDEIRRTYKTSGYILDPHTAVGVAAARRLLDQGSITSPIIVTATAHPGKFPEVVLQAIGVKIPLPTPLVEAMNRKRITRIMRPEYEDFRALLEAS
jgi:threonine synthase